MDLVAGGEVDLVDFVQDIAQEVAVNHTIDGSTKDRGNHVSAVAVGAAKRAEVGKKPGAFCAVRSDGFVLVDECNELRPRDALWFCSLVSPAIGRLNCLAEA